MSITKDALPELTHRGITDEPAPRAPRAVPNGRVPKSDNLILVEPLRRSEMQQSYAQEIEHADQDAQGCYGSMINCLGSVAGLFGSVPLCFCCPNPYKEVKQGNVGLVSKFGRFYKSVDPGLTRINPFSESIKMVNVQINVAQVPQQTVLSRDNVTVHIDSVIYYHVKNPYKASFGIYDVRSALIERAQSTLRHVVGSRLLQNLITEREEIAHEIEEILETVAESWGVTVESILIKDVLFSQELQNSLSSAAQQKRIGESKVIAARAEVDSAKLMREAADILSSPAAMQIRTLESLQAMAKSAGSKVIFVPMNLSNGATDAQALASHDTFGVAGASNINQLSNM